MPLVDTNGQHSIVGPFVNYRTNCTGRLIVHRIYMSGCNALGGVRICPVGL